MLLLVIVRRVLLGLLRVSLDDLDVLWDRTIVTTIPISGIGYWDSLTSLGQNGFGPALLSLQLGIRRRAWAAAPAKADNRRRSRTRESGQPQTPPHPRKRTTADAGAAAAAAARSPDRKRLPCIQVYSVMTPLADSCGLPTVNRQTHLWTIPISGIGGARAKVLRRKFLRRKPRRCSASWWRSSSRG